MEEFSGSRRDFFGATTALAVSAGSAVQPAARSAQGGNYFRSSGWYNAAQDFGAAGNGKTDDTGALQSAIQEAARRQWPLFLPPGNYRITSQLDIPTNTVIIGSGHGLNFGCVIRPENCPALAIGGATQAFHIRIQDLMI